MKIDGQAAIVTGGASGLGRATVVMLAERGARVTIFDMNDEVGPSVATEIGGSYVKMDVSDDASVRAGLSSATEKHGAARILVNCAGIAPAARTVGRGNVPHDAALFAKVIGVNLIGTYNVLSRFAAEAAPLEEIDGERAVIVNTASVAAFDGQIGQAAYAGSKSGIVGLTLPIARDLAPLKIRVMAIAPGIFATPMMKSFPVEVQEALGAQVPHPSRLGRPEEFASLVGSVIENAMLNGETIRLDGGIRMPPK